MGPFPPSKGEKEENCGGIELSNANPCLSLKLASSIDDWEGLNCGGSCSDAENWASTGLGWRMLDGEDVSDFPPLLILLIGLRRTTLPVFSAEAIDETRRIPNATV